MSGSARSGSPVVVPPSANGAVPYTGLIRIWSTSDRLNRDFLRLFLSSPMFDNQIDRLKTGIGLQHWGPYHLGQITLPVPPLDQQIAAVREYAALEERRRSLRRLLVSEIDYLRERRQALVTAAVTGKLDILQAA